MPQSSLSEEKEQIERPTLRLTLSLRRLPTTIAILCLIIGDPFRHNPSDIESMLDIGCPTQAARGKAGGKQCAPCVVSDPGTRSEGGLRAGSGDGSPLG